MIHVKDEHLASLATNNIKLMKNQVAQWGSLAKLNAFLQAAIVS